MIRLYVFFAFLIFSTTLYGAENSAREKADTSGNTPQYGVQQIKKTPESISPSVDKTIPPIKRQNESTNTENQEKKESKSPDYGWWRRFFNDPIAFFTGLLFAATLALFIATRQLVHGAEKTAAQELRAYVFMSPFENSTLSPNSEGCLSIPIKITNFGKTPAYDMMLAVRIGLFAYPLNSALPPVTYPPETSKTVLAPTDFSSTRATLPKLNSAEIERIVRRESAIFVWGEVLYVDAFNQKRFSRMCLYATGIDFASGRLAHHPEGNEAN